MIDQYTYDLLKRLHEFPCGRDNNELEYGRFEAKYRAIYGDIKQIGKILSQLKSLGYLDIPKGTVQFLFTTKGFDVVREYENAIVQNNYKSQLENENLKLQNEQFHYQNQLRSRENEIRELTVENLRLQNKQIRNKILYAVIGGLIGFLLSNWKEILVMLRFIDK